MLKKIGLIFSIPGSSKRRKKKVAININVRNSCREMEKFSIMIRVISTPRGD